MSGKAKAREARIIGEYERAMLLMDTAPMIIHLWDRECKLIDCNKAAARLFGFKDKKDYLEQYGEFSPEYQPDGGLSREKLQALVKEAFDKGICASKWTFRLPDGAPIPADVVLIRKPFANDFVVAGYARDSQENEGGIAGIERLILLHGEENGAAEADADGIEPDSGNRASLADALTINGVDHIKALERFGGDASIFIAVLRSYAASTRPLLLYLRGLLEKGDLAAYAIAVHGIQGSSNGILAREIGSQAEKLEAAAIAGDMDAVKAGHKRLEDAAESLLGALDQVLSAQ